MYRFLISIFLLFTANCFAQIAKDDFAAINKTYSSSNHLSMKMKYEVFKNKNATSALQVENGEVQRNGNASHTRIAKTETIQTDKYTLIVDHEDKNISVLGSDQTKPSENNDKLYMVDLEKLLKLCSKVEFKKENDRQNSYLMAIPSSEYSEVKIIYNKKTMFIEKMVLFYSQAQNLEEKEEAPKEPPRLEITYSEINTNPNFSNDDFTYDKFVEKHNGKFRCKELYKGYTITEDMLNN